MPSAEPVRLRPGATPSRSASAAERRERVLFWLLAGLLLLLALTGGGSRSDILSLVIVRPIAIVACAAAAWTVTAPDLRRCRFALILLAATFALTIAHLIPLPPAAWSALPGRALVATLDARAGLGGTWRPVSLVPPLTRNALYSLFVPLAVLLGGAQIGRGWRERLLLVVLGIALFSGLLGLLQVVGSPTGPLFLYRHTNYGTATGLFANRNHQAIFLATAFPMLAALVTMQWRGSQGRLVVWGALAAGIFLVPLMLVTGSRAGLLLGVVGLISCPLLLRADKWRSRGGSGRRGAHRTSPALRRLTSPVAMALAGGTLVVALGALTMAASRAMSVTRLLGAGMPDELRFKVWPVIVEAIRTYFPVGSGIGSFVKVFQITEPDAILRPTFLNHAHSDVLEVLMTAGAPGLALLLAGLLGWIAGAWRAFRRPIGSMGEGLFARLGIVLIAILALGSLADYPLRTPFLAAVLAVATLWASRADRGSAR